MMMGKIVNIRTSFKLCPFNIDPDKGYIFPLRNQLKQIRKSN